MNCQLSVTLPLYLLDVPNTCRPDCLWACRNDSGESAYRSVYGLSPKTHTLVFELLTFRPSIHPSVSSIHSPALGNAFTRFSLLYGGCLVVLRGDIWIHSLIWIDIFVFQSKLTTSSFKIVLSSFPRHRGLLLFFLQIYKLLFYFFYQNKINKTSGKLFESKRYEVHFNYY